MNTTFHLGPHRRSISSPSPPVADLIARGINWCGTFNHEEAEICFKKATEIDPKFGFGFALMAITVGPNYNDGEPTPRNTSLAAECANKAISLVDLASPVEAAVIRAVYSRVPTAGMTRAEANLAYVANLRQAHKDFPNDDDVAWLLVEGLMALKPWKLWEGGVAAEEVAEILSVIDDGLKVNPNHPGLLHMHIHAWEMSPTPGKALETSRLLFNKRLIPDGSHLLHMPSHIFVLVGDYAEAVASNEAATEVDRKYFALKAEAIRAERGSDISEDEVMAEAKCSLRGKDEPTYPFLYFLHNIHMLCYAAMLCGRQQAALKSAREAESVISDRLIELMGDLIESFTPMVFHVMIRFGMWQQILDEPLPRNPELRLMGTATARYARSIAFAALRRNDDAEKEFKLFEEARAKVPSSRVLFNNTCHDILAVAYEVGAGEVAYGKADYERAFVHLRRAVVLDDALPYDEPWGWMMPSRHPLGALLLEQGHRDEAEQVYRRDLEMHPNNVWSLHGLVEILESKEGVGSCCSSDVCPLPSEELMELQRALENAQALADVKIFASCCCRGLIPK